MEEMKLIKPLKTVETKDQKEIKETKKMIIQLNSKVKKITDKIYGKLLMVF
jgi:hypothetical protein